MDCRETQALLTAFHDCESAGADRARVEGHLRDCAECRRLLADMARADEVAGVPDPGRGYWDRFNARVADRIDREEQLTGAAVRRPEPGWMTQQLRYFIPAVAAAMLVVVVVRYAGRGPVVPVPTPPRAEAVKERPATDPAGQRVAKAEIERPAAKTTGHAAAPGPPAAEPVPAAAAAAERNAAAASQAAVAAAGEAGTAEEKRRTTSDAALPVAERPHAEKAESAARMSIAKEQAAPAAASAAPAGKAAAKAIGMQSSPDAARAAAPCEAAEALAARGQYREAEAAQRECLARDPSPPAQERGLVFLAELLDRQARYAEADAVIADVHRQYPKSLRLDQYRQQRPMVQQQRAPVPAVR